MRRPRTPLRLEMPLIAFLAFLWMAVWRDFSFGTLLVGLVLATAIVRVFYLPPLRGTGRFNLFWWAVFAGRFLGRMAVASFQVAWLAVVRGPRVRSAIVAVQLRSHDDFLVTMVGHAVALVPGSLVLDVDRTTTTLYLHCLDFRGPQDIEQVRRSVLRDEALLIRAGGTPSDLAGIRAEKRLGRTPGLSPAELRAHPPIGGSAGGSAIGGSAGGSATGGAAPGGVDADGEGRS